MMESENGKHHTPLPKDTVSQLGVTEEEHNGSVVDAILEEAALHILPPLSSTVVLGELDLETVILCPVKEGWDNNTVDDFLKKRLHVLIFCNVNAFFDSDSSRRHLHVCGEPGETLSATFTHSKQQSNYPALHICAFTNNNIRGYCLYH